MAASGDVTVASSGGGPAKLHPYVLTLVRWCMSSLWGTATVILHRLMTAPLTPIAAPKLLPKPQPKPRAPGTDHLHPEPKVECVVLHEPSLGHTLDVIFVHGLYGSLGNTWRQGDWRKKYKIIPNIVPLRTHNKENSCECNEMINNPENEVINDNECQINDNYLNSYDSNLNDNLSKDNLDKLKKILPNEDMLITEKFYNNCYAENAENYEVQAEFVKDMFKNDNCDNNKTEQNKFKHMANDNKFNECKCRFNEIKCNINKGTGCFNYENEIFDKNSTLVEDREDKCKNDEIEKENYKMKCKLNEMKICEMGCGCVCDDCYSLCWPKDWIKLDFPGARVISINYTSDPYLWRPLWVKGNKRLRLHERADQMMEQLLNMGVGEKPIVWVGHSKGGLFIKQIYCEAYETYLNLHKKESKTNKFNNESAYNIHSEEQNIILDNLINSRVNICDNNFNQTQISKDNKDSNNSCSEAVFDNETNIKTENKNILYVDSKFTEDNQRLDSKDVNKNIVNDNVTIKRAVSVSNVNTKDKIVNDKEGLIMRLNKDVHEFSNIHLKRKVEGYRSGMESSLNNDNYNTEHQIMKNKEDLFNENINGISINIRTAENSIEENKMSSNCDLSMNVNEMINNNNDNAKIDNNEMIMIDSENDISRKELNDRSNKYHDISIRNDKTNDELLSNDNAIFDAVDLSNKLEDRKERLASKAKLWKNSAGFMFYSVPHRGSPLADIKTPITSRSIELLEISKDCALVLALQERWLTATASPKPAVRSLVETCKTLMSVLWLRIVSVDSADAGIGTLSGVAVDHREICKPTSRTCKLYKELTDLIHEALNKCNCKD